MNIRVLFLGHIYVGLLYFLAAFWWYINIFKDFYFSKYRGKTYVNQPWYIAPVCRKVPPDTLVKLLLCIVFMGAVIGVHAGQLGRHPLNLVHFMMATAILLNALCDLIKCNHLLPLPDGIEAATGSMIFVHNYFLFTVHANGRNPTDYFVHLLLAYLSLSVAVVIYLETCNRHSPMLSLTRAFLIQLQGTWFIQIGFLLYSPSKWHIESSSENFPSTPQLAAALVAHSVANVIFILFVGTLVYFYMKTRGFIHLDTQERKNPYIKDTASSALLTNGKCELLIEQS